MQRVSWSVTEPGQTPPRKAPANPKRTVPYTTKYRIKEDTPADQRKTMEHWNLMVDVLKENGLMDEK